MGFSQARDQTCDPCIGRQILNYWTTREVTPSLIFLFNSLWSKSRLCMTWIFINVLRFILWFQICPPWFMFHVYLKKKKSVVNGCWVTCSIKINRSSSLIEMFRCSFSVYLLRLKFTSKSYPFLELSQNDHTYEDCTDLSSNHGSITHSLCALQLSSVAQLCPTLCNPMDCM